MNHRSSAKILIGISLNPEESKHLLSWAISSVAHPNDTVVALHILGEQKRKKESLASSRTQYRQAKASVISVMGEFAKICQSKQVNLEAKVGFSSNVGKGLIEEANSISADFLIVGRPTNQSNRNWRGNVSYCFDHAPETCSVVLMAKRGLPQHKFAQYNDEVHMEFKKGKNSPRAMHETSEGELNSTEEDTSSFGDSSIRESPPPPPPASRHESKLLKPASPFKRISSFLLSPLDLSSRKSTELESKKGKPQPLLRCFSYEEIAKATNNFHPDNMVGRGGYSEVYRGDLESGKIIAVKKLSNKEKEDEIKEKEFLMEIGAIGHVNHPNTAVLVGCCIENGLHLVFNFSPNGTLASALHGKGEKEFEWSIRYKIALGIARGLHYLHKCCKHRIIHRDIKASNVLLGPDYEPQISDFGLAKWLPNKWTHHEAIPIEGTFGYLAPEYFMHGVVDEKTDVFAFGVLLLEIITGRRPIDSSKQSLLLWANPLMESGNITELADPKLGDKYDLVQMQKLVLTASYCVRQSSIWRPSMNEVLELLTYGNDCEAAKIWRMPKFSSEDMDYYSMVFGCDLQLDVSLESI